jgi:hypothetical protein
MQTPSLLPKEDGCLYATSCRSTMKELSVNQPARLHEFYVLSSNWLAQSSRQDKFELHHTRVCRAQGHLQFLWCWNLHAHTVMSARTHAHTRWTPVWEICCNAIHISCTLGTGVCLFYWLRRAHRSWTPSGGNGLPVCALQENKIKLQRLQITAFPKLFFSGRTPRIIVYIPRNACLRKRKQNKAAVVRARRLLQYCQLPDKNSREYFEAYL